MDDPIANSLGVEPLPKPATKTGEIVKTLETQTPSTDVAPLNETIATRADELERDYNYARGNMYDVIEKGMEGVYEMLDIAKQDQHARSFEVVATLMKQVVEANKDLVEISRQKNAPKDHEKAVVCPDNVTNNLFVGSTAELQQMIKNTQKQ